MSSKSVVSLIATGLATLTLAGCGSTAATSETVEEEISFTRTEYFDSIEEITAESDLIVTGTVGSQWETMDLDETLPFTLSEFHISDSLYGEPESSIVIRQAGSKKQLADEDELHAGKEYLLFLVNSGLPGELSDQYYIAGVDAGIYHQEHASPCDDTIFVRADPSSGDRLPHSIETDSLE